MDPHATTVECRTIDSGLVEGCIGLAHKQVVTFTETEGGTFVVIGFTSVSPIVLPIR